MKDLKLNKDLELVIKNGDFVIDDSDKQQQELLLLCNKGSFKENPAACVGLFNFLESEDRDALLKEIKLQFVSDGMEVKNVEFKDGKLITEAYYK